jgi:hypothetical protein
MAGPAQVLKPPKNLREMAMFLAMVVRNAMEDFHSQHLTDDQMRALNPIIRNALYTGRQALRHYERSEGARSFADFQKMLIPKYWEQPELLPDFVEAVRMNDDRRRTSRPGRTRPGDPTS